MKIAASISGIVEPADSLWGIVASIGACHTIKQAKHSAGSILPANYSSADFIFSILPSRSATRYRCGALKRMPDRISLPAIQEEKSKMTTSSHQDTATIYQFPVGGRAGLKAVHHGSTNVSDMALSTTGEHVLTDAWYHQDAIREARQVVIQ